MQWLLSTYTSRLNRRHETPGHVFSGRYKALVIEPEGGGYLKSACDYVHLYPVRAGLVPPLERLLSYPWSSRIWYVAGRAHRPGWMRVDRLLGEHGIKKGSAEGREEFERRMEARRREEVDEEVLRSLRRGWCLGSSAFRARRMDQLGEGGWSQREPGVRRQSAEAKAENIIAEELERMRWTAADVEGRRKSDPGKLRIVARLRKEKVLSVKRIAARMHLGSYHTANANLLSG